MNKDEFLSLLPPVVAGNESLNALTTAVADLFSEQYSAINLDGIYGRIDELPESLLDILAKDFKVDWWTQEMSLEDKRNTLKSSWFVHRKKGTKGAVKTALSSVYEDSDVTEWFEYNGQPYHFRILIDDAYESTDLNKYRAVINQVGTYKNVRSYLDAVEYVSKGATAMQYVDAHPLAFSLQDVCITPYTVIGGGLTDEYNDKLVDEGDDQLVREL